MNRIDRYSETWAAIEAHATSTIEKCQRSLEASLLSERASDELRGEIKALRTVLALQAPARKILDDDNPRYGG